MLPLSVMGRVGVFCLSVLMERFGSLKDIEKSLVDSLCRGSVSFCAIWCS